METRKLILQLAGHRVITAMNEIELAVACESNPFDVVVIGQTAKPSIKRSIYSMVRNRCPSAKILELYSPHQGRSLEDAESWMEVPAAVPRDLADRVSELAKSQRDVA